MAYEHYGYQGKLLKMIEPKPVPKPPELFLFEETEATIEFRWKGHVLKNGASLCDIYGPGTSVISAKEEANNDCHEYQVTSKSELEIVVVKITRIVVKKKKGVVNWPDSRKGEIEYEQVQEQDSTYEDVWSSQNNEIKPIGFFCRTCLTWVIKGSKICPDCGRNYEKKE